MSTADDWARGFFSGVFVDLWLGATTQLQTFSEVDFLEKVLRVPPGARLLDVACGGGRHSLEFAGRGYQMTGVDLSTEFLNAARAETEERGLEVEWELRPMHAMTWVGAFDGAFCMGNSLGGLEDADLVASFAAVARALKPGARFVVNTSTVAESWLPNVKERSWWQFGNITFLVHNHYDHVRGRLDMEFTFIRDGQTEKRSGFSRVHTYKEFCGLLEEAGFAPNEGYANAAQEPYKLGARELYLVATKTVARA